MLARSFSYHWVRPCRSVAKKALTKPLSLAPQAIFPGCFVNRLALGLACLAPPEKFRTVIQHFGHCVPVEVSAKIANAGVKACPHTGQFMLSSFNAPHTGIRERATLQHIINTFGIGMPCRSSPNHMTWYTGTSHCLIDVTWPPRELRHA